MQAQPGAHALLAPAAGAHEAVGLRHQARGAVHQADRGVGDVLGHDVRRIGDRDAALRRGVQVEPLQAGALARQQLQVGQPVELRRARAMHRGGDGDAEAGARSLRRLVLDQVEALGQSGAEVGGDRAEQQDRLARHLNVP